MKKDVRWFALFAIVLILTITGIVMAGTYRSPSKDTACDATVNSWCYNNSGVQPSSSGIAACNPAQVGLIGWDLSGVSGTIDSAQLTLTTYFVTGAPLPPATVTFELYEPSAHDWTETNADISLGSSGTTIATATVALTNDPLPPASPTPQTVVFSGAALGAYFNSLKATGPATIGVRITEGCGNSALLVSFNDRENSGNLPGGAAATEPDLILFTPTAVSLSSFTPAGEAPNSTGTTFLVIGALGLAVMATSYAALPMLRKRKRQA